MSIKQSNGSAPPPEKISPLRNGNSTYRRTFPTPRPAHEVSGPWLGDAVRQQWRLQTRIGHRHHLGIVTNLQKCWPRVESRLLELRTHGGLNRSPWLRGDHRD